jgi:hypothetical protein
MGKVKGIIFEKMNEKNTSKRETERHTDKHIEHIERQKKWQSKILPDRQTDERQAYTQKDR